MGLSIHKPGQGYWTRMGTAVGVGTLVLVGVAWLTSQVEWLMQGSDKLIYWQAGVAVATIFLAAGILWWVLNKPSVVNFLIATEAEMKKVNWPSRREIIVSTWIVICGTLLMALLLFGSDALFSNLFKYAGILPT